MSAFVKTRDSALNAIKRYMTKSTDVALSVDLDQVESYLQLLNEQWARYNAAQDEVDTSCGIDNAAIEESTRSQAETWYTTALSNFNRVRECRVESPNHNVTQSTTVSASIRLPKMELPTFSGDSTEWISFYDSFCSLVDSNTALSDGQKMHYLRSCLKGDALKVVSGFKICDANYKEAWDLLKSRFNIMRVIVESHFKAMADVRKATSDTASAIKAVLNPYQQHVRELKALGRHVDFWDDWLVHEIVGKLSFETRKQWELSLLSDAPPTFEQLSTFLDTRCTSLSMLSAAAPLQPSKPATTSKPTKALHAISDPNTNSCPCCRGAHKIYSCEKFISLDPISRSKFVKQSHLCINCLSSGHYKPRCNSSSSCRKCGQRHHTLLHGTPVVTNSADTAENQQTTSNYAAADNTSGNNTTALSAIAFSTDNPTPERVSSCVDTNAAPLPENKTILLATALVKVRDCAGRFQQVRLLFDSGSHASFVTESCVRRLGLRRSSSTALITGIGSSQGGRARGQVSLSLSSNFSDQCYAITALILPKITGNLPTQKVSIHSWPHIQGLALADPHFMRPGPIDLLIGMDVMETLICSEIRKGPCGMPTTQRTVFGWTIFGSVDNPSTPCFQPYFCEVQLERALTRLWELEDAPEKKYLTREEQFCEEHFEATHTRAPDGRFIVELPLKSDVPLGESRTHAVRNLLRIERKLAIDNDLRIRYNEFMQELISMNHMEAAVESSNPTFYMPHHPVIKESSVTTKLRVVFNASAKTTNANSLNDALFVGPQLQKSLISILLRFRTHRYAVTADIAKMYRQVCVSPKHIDLQRIVWRSDPSQPIQDFRMLRVTYGVAAASHLAVKALQQSTRYSTNGCERAAAIIQRDFYMDDLLTGASSADELQSLQQNVSEILLESGFELRKWASNCVELNKTISSASENISHYIAEGKDVHALGLVWNTEEDCFTFSINLKQPPRLATKRAFLSDASTLFDPLGLLAPTTIKSKMWFQDIWRAEVGWDELIPDKIAESWCEHRSELLSLTNLKVPRWVGCKTSDSATELHVFSDASERAYAAVIYARTVQGNGQVTVSLISAKTKVAPIKSTTLPRLELCAAHLASKLVRSVLESWDKRRYPLYAWTDSTITLAWLQAHPSRWETFIANRVADIQGILPPECWHHVRSERNPADCASRGLTPQDLIQHQLWWSGPDFLYTEDQFWKQFTPEPHLTELGLRKKVAVHITVPEESWPIMTKYSSFSKLRRVIAYVLRFIHNTRASKNRTLKIKDTPNCQELAAAELRLIKYTQNMYFINEISHCREKKPIPLRSSLLRLQPYLDPSGVLRVGGRLKSADVSLDAKHPIILPKNSPLSKLIISDIHKYTLHAGPRLMTVVLQHRYWIIGARSLIRSIYHKCVKCTCLNRNTSVQSMGDLPSSRTIYARCFTRTAVDFAGPYSYKFAHGRGSKSTKGYIASFICMCTGAMHLEFVGDLSSSAFLNAFKRFINRRGYCKAMYSDNGTNFVGADRELHERYEKSMADDKLRSFFADSNIEWHFNAPTAPHMGGYWEVGIKRIKYHIKRVLEGNLLSFEEFSTLLTEVEACVNSRPLCADPTSATDLEALTPGHFLVGEPLKSIPEPEGQGFCGNLLQRWHLISSMRQHFWRRWRDEYLLNLQRRTKWFRSSRNYEEGDVVALFDERTPPTKWTLARVIRCHPGKDGNVRVVTVKTSNGEYVRPVARLCLLPTKEDLFCDSSSENQ